MQSVKNVSIDRLRSGDQSRVEDLVVVEEPLEIRLGFGAEGERMQRSVSVTMRTPGHDLDLALGFLFTEGILQQWEDVRWVGHCEQVQSEEERGNVVRVEVRPGISLDWDRLQRHFYTSSSCGVCGKASLEAIETQACFVLRKGEPRVAASLLTRLPDLCREQQVIFKHTGGIHAAGLFNAEGDLLCLREDIGRHNAVDKVVGDQWQRGNLPLEQGILLLSGRAGFELVQKALMAGIGVLVSVGAPSSLAVDLAQKGGVTLVGFVREQGFNVYSHPERVIFEK